jgi:hypothetical protein
VQVAEQVSAAGKGATAKGRRSLNEPAVTL